MSLTCVAHDLSLPGSGQTLRSLSLLPKRPVRFRLKILARCTLPSCRSPQVVSVSLPSANLSHRFSEGGPPPETHGARIIGGNAQPKVNVHPTLTSCLITPRRYSTPPHATFRLARPRPSAASDAPPPALCSTPGHFLLRLARYRLSATRGVLGDTAEIYQSQLDEGVALRAGDRRFPRCGYPGWCVSDAVDPRGSQCRRQARAHLLCDGIPCVAGGGDPLRNEIPCVCRRRQTGSVKFARLQPLLSAANTLAETQWNLEAAKVRCVDAGRSGGRKGWAKEMDWGTWGQP